MGQRKEVDGVMEHRLMSDYDVYLFREGRHSTLYDKMGAHVMALDGAEGTHFAVWAPNARSVGVVGDFNGWNRGAAPLFLHEDGSGIWEGFVPGVGEGSLYKYFVSSNYGGYSAEKADPYATMCEVPPRTASVVHNLGGDWADGSWSVKRIEENQLNSPISIYECHLGSWRRVPEEEGRALTYSEAAGYLPEYLDDMEYSHVEFLPLLEHPF